MLNSSKKYNDNRYLDSDYFCPLVVHSLHLQVVEGDGYLSRYLFIYLECIYKKLISATDKLLIF